MPHLLSPHSSLLSGAAYAAPWWLPGGHAQTIYASLFAPRPRIAYRRERWETPDADFIDLDWLDEAPADGSLRDDNSNPEAPVSAASAPPGVASPKGPLLHPSARHRQSPVVTSQPLVVLFHGLEGSSRSHYAASTMAAVSDAGWRGVVVHFRGCSGEANRLPRAYHSGDAREIGWLLRRFRERHRDTPLFAVGVSLGGNALLKWLGESGADALAAVDRAAAVSAPLDLMISGDALGKGFNLLYTRHFLRTLKPKSLDKLNRFPNLFDATRLRAAWTLRAFDNVVTAPLHGYRNTDDYWTRASSKAGLRNIEVPTLVINARNDPFLPCGALPAPHEVAPAVTLEQPDDGGHCGFVSGAFPGSLDWLPQRILDFLGAHANER